MMRLVILGAPGAGKGTQAEALSNRFHIPTISTGEMIRHAMRDCTPLGLEAKPFMEKGMLLPDDIVIAMIKGRLAKPDCLNGFILDGFPRTVPQAIALEALDILIDYALDLDVSDESIIGRLSGRRQCTTCGATYHIDHKPPKVVGVCDLDGGTLSVRTDDEPHMVATRLRIYHQQTEPLEKFYADKGILRVAVGQADVESTTKECLKMLGVLK